MTNTNNRERRLTTARQQLPSFAHRANSEHRPASAPRRTRILPHCANPLPSPGLRHTLNETRAALSMQPTNLPNTQGGTVNNTNNRKRRQAGVTLIEMLVVVTIIALFAAVVAPRMLRRADTARHTAARTQINSFMTALGAYKLDTGLFPANEQGLRALRERPQGLNGWQGPYLPQDIPADPWGRNYLYKFPGEHGDEPDVISYGADGTAGGEGINADIVSWKSQ